jgi:hypothetical protein
MKGFFVTLCQFYVKYCDRFEQVLGVPIPYWDSVMDSYLPNPRDSMIFTAEFMGATDDAGKVIDGPVAFWRTVDGGTLSR